MAAPTPQPTHPSLMGYLPVHQDETQIEENPPRTCCKKVALVAMYTIGVVITLSEFGYGAFKIYQGTIPDYPYRRISTGLGVSFIIAGIVSAALGVWTHRKMRVAD